jgi:hypothetical protein
MKLCSHLQVYYNAKQDADVCSFWEWAGSMHITFFCLFAFMIELREGLLLSFLKWPSLCRPLQQRWQKIFTFTWCIILTLLWNFTVIQACIIFFLCTNIDLNVVFCTCSPKTVHKLAKKLWLILDKPLIQ